MIAVYGGIEGGGTKFVCAVGSGPDELHSVCSFDTEGPEETLDRAAAFFGEQQEALWRQGSAKIEAVGVAMFGPVDVRPGSPSYGHVLSTPKAGWSGADILGPLSESLGVPLVLDTDVNAAALAEWRWGAACECDPALYLTVGTGIGGGVFVNGRPLHGLLHPEMGHIHVRRHPNDPASFLGICPFHGDCLEGMASGPALEQRWGSRPEALPVDHPAWDIQAYYLAQAVVTCIYTLAPERIVLGGGVMRGPGLLAKVRREVRILLKGYLRSEAVGAGIDAYIVAPALGDRAGVLGALALAERLQ